MLGLTLPAGCMIPTYHQPQGFSSTYYRHLHQTNQAFQASGPNPFPSAAMSQPETKTETSNSKDAKPPAEDDKSAEPAAKIGNWWSWIQRPFRSDAKVDADEPEDDEETADQTADRPRNATR